MGFDGFFFWGSNGIHGMQEGFFKREIQINLSKDIGNWMEFRGWIFQELWISSANISFFESSKSVLTILGGIFVDGNNIWTFCDDLLSLAISGTDFKWEVPIPYIFGLYIYIKPKFQGIYHDISPIHMAQNMVLTNVPPCIGSWRSPIEF